jgi:competence protein ComEA
LSLERPPESSPHVTVAAFALVTLAIVGALILLLATRPDPVQITVYPPNPTATLMPTATPEAITVYVTGAVRRPGSLLTLPYDSHVSDALDAVGGVSDEADLTRVNMAALLYDGDQVHVPAREDVTIIATATGGEQLNVNRATAEDLMTLPGIGPTLAERIIEYRTRYGLFAEVDDLLNVSGIGPTLLEGIADLIRFR